MTSKEDEAVKVTARDLRRITVGSSRMFESPYDQHQDRNGYACEVVEKIAKPDANHDVDVLPMYRIRFKDGFEIEAWPEEILASVN